MIKIELSVDGMKCGMCEAHVNDVVRKVKNVKSVKSSHTKNLCTVIALDDINVEDIKNAITKEGYKVSNEKIEPYEKQGLFKKIFKK